MASPERTSSSDTTLRLQRVFAAPREKVFRAFTDPEELKSWFGPNDEVSVPVVEVDLRVGGRYRIDLKTADGSILRILGSYREIRAPERLVYTWRWEGGDPNETLVTVEFRDLGAQTEVSLIHERFADLSTRDRHGAGWGGSFEKLARRLG